MIDKPREFLEKIYKMYWREKPTGNIENQIRSLESKLKPNHVDLLRIKWLQDILEERNRD